MDTFPNGLANDCRLLIVRFIHYLLLPLDLSFALLVLLAPAKASTFAANIGLLRRDFRCQLLRLPLFRVEKTYETSHLHELGRRLWP